MIVPPNYGLYEKSSNAFLAVLRKYTDVVEQYSIDEAFMDMSGTESLFGPPVVAANTIKDEIYHTLGFTVNVGISSNRLLAKMASDFRKPNLVHTLFPEEIEKKMWPLPVRDLFFVGKVSERKLHSMGIRTNGDLARMDVNVLKSMLKKHGEVIWNFANGRDVSVVEPEPPDNKGYGNSTTIAFDVTDAPTAKMVLLSLAETVGRRLRKDGVKVEVASVSIRFNDKSNLIQQDISYTGKDDLNAKANACFSGYSSDQVYSLKQQILIEKEFSKLQNVYGFYEALNKIIRQYSYLRKHFWVHKIDENILEGTLVQNYLDGKFYSSYTHAGLIPSILPSKKKYPDISDEEKELLDNRLINDFQIPIEDELILVARSLWYRLEYRSAIIESSTSLEVVVEKKLVEKMKSQGKNDSFIEDELKKTETNFNQRCDVFLKRYTGQSFVQDNSSLWQIINQHRKDYRHRIAHSSIKPDRNTTEKIINDFEKAIKYISAL